MTHQTKEAPVDGGGLSAEDRALIERVTGLSSNQGFLLTCSSMARLLAAAREEAERRHAVPATPENIAAASEAGKPIAEAYQRGYRACQEDIENTLPQPNGGSAGRVAELAQALFKAGCAPLSMRETPVEAAIRFLAALNKEGAAG